MPTNIDVIILSYAKNSALKKLTEQTIASCVNSENPGEISFNIVVIESYRELEPFQFEHSTTIYPTAKFGFHRYLNIGIRNTAHDYICFCNNDLIFHKHWATEILNAMKQNPGLQCCNTFCDNFHQDKAHYYNGNINYGYENGLFFTGWCFLVKRSIFDITGFFDEKFEFWFSDDDFRLTLKKKNLANALVIKSKVTHLRSETLNKADKKKQKRLQYSSLAYYKFKWQHHNPLKYYIEMLKYKLKVYIS
ncbi:glycosyltransferase family 2 protein [Pedobacter sp. Leaf176]|uniref:glycosyltransferase family 2 protein n=1 Tax=Pedobacter sp. Leaf176 TaxID=1736286 RepID=UPI0006FDE739|nr:glycosyltransferase [Pedobacter sp. Leaf176]KQR72694.1 hypothetical protein ASF92_05315 [Pedobacter sp. Leaf176]